MLALLIAALLAQAPAEPARCNAAGRAAQPLAGCTLWEPLRSNVEGTGFVDPASARRDGNRVEVTVRILFREPIETAHSLHTRFGLDCVARTAWQVYLTGFDAAGRVLAEGPAPNQAPHVVRPDTPYADLLARFCGR